MTDTKALIERNNAWPAAMGRGDALSADFVTALLAENSARIAALEAHLQAKEDGLKVRDRRIAALDAEVARLKALGDGLAGALRNSNDPLLSYEIKALAAWEKNSDQ